tara:strand:- start:670 stop:921 length:252 start_codon:yes stop_codon:yes gene_type:complete
MSKQSIYVKHKDEIFVEYKRIVEVIMENYENGINRNYTQGKKEALEWVLGLDKTQEQKDQEFADKIDALTNKGESNEKRNTEE